LLYVRGFSAPENRFVYEVNKRFGATRPQLITLRTPVTLTASMRFDLGATRERQQLIQQMNTGRHTPGTRMQEQSFRSMGTSGVGNPMSNILRQQDSLRLTAV